MQPLRCAFGLLAASVLALPAMAQVQIQIAPGVPGGAPQGGVGGPNPPKIIINGQEVQGGPIQIQPIQVQPNIRMNNAVQQRAEIIKQLEKAVKDLENPSDKVNLEQVRKDLAEIVAKLRNMPVGPNVIQPIGRPPVRGIPGQPVPLPAPLPPVKTPEL